MKTVRYWLRERIRIQQEHIKFLEFRLDLEEKMRKYWEELYKEKQ